MSDFKRHVPAGTDIHTLQVAFNRIWDAIEAGATPTVSQGQAVRLPSGVISSVGGQSGGGVTPPHNELSGLQGGNVANYWHLTQAEYNGTGTGVFARAVSPSLTTPNIGAATATSINKVSITQPTTSATFTIADGKIFTASNTLTFLGVDGSSLDIGTGGVLGTAAYVADASLVHKAGTETISGVKTFSAKTYHDDAVVMPKTSGTGIQVDTAAPTYPWVDMLGIMIPDPGGANSPILASISGGACRTYAYTGNDKMDCQIHVTHDYLPGSDVFVHLHWLHNGTAISGNLVVSIKYQYGKGHNQAPLTAEKTLTLTYNTVNIATTPRYQTRIDELQLSSAGGSATLLDSALIEPDGLFFLNFTVTTLPTISGGGSTRVFIPYVDIHAQSTCIGTKQKAPNFYV